MGSSHFVLDALKGQKLLSSLNRKIPSLKGATDDSPLCVSVGSSIELKYFDEQPESICSLVSIMGSSHFVIDVL